MQKMLSTLTIGRAAPAQGYAGMAGETACAGPYAESMLLI
ncbi:hypothetical protein MASSI9I_40161 [Massilia sp. 9I]|nr:hypothetical protein MASSI9I_40161 [Massilia sp. 9I]